jgi:catechol 2,3-dioxygenase-like lactoylglutathione lyase family enzyme
VNAPVPAPPGVEGGTEQLVAEPVRSCRSHPGRHAHAGLGGGLADGGTEVGIKGNRRWGRAGWKDSRHDVSVTATGGTDSSSFPIEGVEMTVQFVVGNLERSRRYYREVLGATETGSDGTSVFLTFQGIVLVLVTGGGPTAERPDVTFRPPADIGHVSLRLTMRVPDCRQAYEVLRSRGAGFLAPPVDYDTEIRAFFRDPDGHLLEISQAV